MRHFISISFFLILLPASASVLAADHSGRADNEMFDWAVEQSNALDRNWQDTVNRTSSGQPAMRASVQTGRSKVMHRYGSRTSAAMPGLLARDGVSSTWSNRGVSSNGFIHRGISSDNFSLVARKRNGASRGLNMPKSPASARLAGTRRIPFTSMNLKSSFTTSTRGAGRKSPQMGTRRGGSSRTRTAVSSSSRLGSSRSRRRR